MRSPAGVLHTTDQFPNDDAALKVLFLALQRKRAAASVRRASEKSATVPFSEGMRNSTIPLDQFRCYPIL